MPRLLPRRARRAIRRSLDAVGPPVRDGSLALLYHRAAREDSDPWRLAVTPDHLSQHLEVLAASTRPLTSGGLHQALDAGRLPPRSVVLTFDDGYADLATEVAPRLAKADVPATMYVVSRAVDRDREFWWDALERAMLGPEAGTGPLALTVGGERREWDVTGTDRADVHRQVWATLRRCQPEERDALTDEVLAWAGLDPWPRVTHRTLRSHELAGLADDGLVEIGAHTATHPWLAGLPAERQRAEITEGRREIEELVGQPVRTFAYPHGGPDDVGPLAPTLVAEAGFDTGFLASAGRLGARRGRRGPFTLPRLFVEDMDGDAFARLLWRYAGIRAG